MAALGVSQAELARRVGVAQPTIFKLLSGGGSSRYLHRIARELGTTPEYLSGEVDDPDLNAPPPPELTRTQQEIVDCLHQLTPEDQKAVLYLVQRLCTAQPEQRTLHSGRLEYRAE